MFVHIYIHIYVRTCTYIQKREIKRVSSNPRFLKVCKKNWGKGFSDLRSLFVSGMINIQRTPTNHWGLALINWLPSQVVSAKSIVQELHQKEKSNLEAQVTVEQDVLVGNWSGTHVRGFFSWYKCYIMLYIYIYIHIHTVYVGGWTVHFTEPYRLKSPLGVDSLVWTSTNQLV